MNMNIFRYLLLTLVVACKKQSTPAAMTLPAPDTTILADTYSLVTAANSITMDTGTVYKLSLAPHASFFKFDCKVKYGDIYYDAIQESTKHFSPLKFFIDNSTGQVVAVARPSPSEAERFNKVWQR